MIGHDRVGLLRSELCPRGCVKLESCWLDGLVLLELC